MKRNIYAIFLILVLCLFGASCAKDANTKNGTAERGNASLESVDLDLTALSSTMVYAEVSNIMLEPDQYVGKTIRGSGAYDAFFYEEMGAYFHYFIIADATDCCVQSLDFLLLGAPQYPDDYPNVGEEIEVAGVFTKGEVNGSSYYYIAAEDFVVLD